MKNADSPQNSVATPVAESHPQALQLTPEEALIVAPFFAACEAKAEAYREAMEAAKRLLLQQVLQARKGG